MMMAQQLRQPLFTLITLHRFLTVYFKTYTEASYDDIGTIFMCGALLCAIIRPTVCSFADRYGTYKHCLMSAVGMFCLGNIALVMLPFYFKLVPNTDLNPRFVWYLVATCSSIAGISSGVIITFDDVFVIHQCRQSKSGEYFGQYRYFGSFGWALSAVGLALIEKYIDLPYMVLPMASSCILALADFLLITQLRNIKHDEKSSIVNLSDIISNTGGDRLSITTDKKSGSTSNKNEDTSRHSNDTVYQNTIADKTLTTTIIDNVAIIPAEPVATKNDNHGPNNGMTTNQLQLNNLRSDENAGKEKISISLQLTLLYRLNKYDNYNMIKYLLVFVILGAIIQLHYAFYLQFMTEVLNTRNLITLLFAFSAVVQIIICVGESCGLLWIARLMIKTIGRDASLVTCVVISGARYALSGFFNGHLNIWLLAALEIQTGFLWGITYTLMTEFGSCYLTMLDNLLAIECKGSNCGQGEIEFLASLNKLKKVYSIESIRCALKATIQSIFSGAFEGFGFALGPFVAGLWLNSNGNSLANLYQDLGTFHLAIVIIIVVLEYGLIRCLMGSRSKADRLKYY